MAGVAIIAFLNSETEGHQNRIKACEIFLDREEHVHRSLMALEALDLVVGVDHNGRLKVARRRRHCSPPPRHFSVVVAGQDLLGFEEEVGTNSTQEESHKKVAGAGRYRRSKLSAAAAVFAAVRRRQPPNHRRTTTRLKSLTRRFKPHWTRRLSSPEPPSTAGQSCRVCLGRR